MTIEYETSEGRPKIRFTVEGGLAVRLVNKTGSNSVKGSLVQIASGTDNAFVLTGSDDVDCVGVVYEDGIADGSECWVVTQGIAQVLLKDTTGSTRGYWAATSDTAGRADCTNAASPGLVLSHFQEIGHCLETKGSGTDVLARVILHFN